MASLRVVLTLQLGGTLTACTYSVSPVFVSNHVHGQTRLQLLQGSRSIPDIVSGQFPPKMRNSSETWTVQGVACSYPKALREPLRGLFPLDVFSDGCYKPSTLVLWGLWSSFDHSLTDGEESESF